MVLTVRYVEMQAWDLKIFYSQGHPLEAQSLHGLLFDMKKTFAKFSL